MELSFLDLKEREIINVYDGKKLGRVVDIVFNNETGLVRGIVVPGDKKMFHRVDDVFIPIEKIKRIGNDVILVGLQRESNYVTNRSKKDNDKNIKAYENYYNRYYPNQNNYSSGYNGNYYNGKNNRDNINKREHSIVERQNANNYNYPAKQDKVVSNNTYVSGSSFVRLKPLDRKKYK